MKSGWRGWLERQFLRIDGLSLRERVIAFFAVLGTCAALAQVLWLGPAQAKHQQLTQRFAKQNTELQRLRDSVKASAQPSHSKPNQQSELAGINERLVVVNHDIAQATQAPRQTMPLSQVLAQLLRRHEGLTLVATTALAPEVASGESSSGMLRQGVQLAVSGPYAELVRYLQTLEVALPYVRWGELNLKSDKQPPELSLQLFLVGVAS